MSDSSTYDESALLQEYLKLINTLESKEFVLKGGYSKNPDESTLFVNLEAAERHLNASKAQTRFRGGQQRAWGMHTEWTHPLGRSTLQEDVGRSLPPGLSRAYYKCADLVSRFDRLLTATSGQALKTLHLCEAPGQFVAAIADAVETRGEVQIDWSLNSLNPHYEWISKRSMLTDDSLIALHPERMIFGASNSGDIFDLEDDLDLSPFIDAVDLVTADGSIDCTDNPGAQEVTVLPLIAREIDIAFRVLKPGGCAIFKFFTFFDPRTRDLLARICLNFEKVIVRKPPPSKPGNSEVYVVGMGFLAKVILGTITDDSENNIKKAACFFAQHQRFAIDLNLALRSPNPILKCQIDEIKLDFAKRFFSKIKIGLFWTKNTTSHGPCDPFWKMSNFPDVFGTQYRIQPFINKKIPQFLTSVVVIPKKMDKPVVNVIFSKKNHQNILNFEEFSKTADFEDKKLQNGLKTIENGKFTIKPWQWTKKAILNATIEALRCYDTIIVSGIPNVRCGFPSRFSVSFLAVLMDFFEVRYGRGTSGEQEWILERYRSTTADVLCFLEGLAAKQDVFGDVACFVPLCDFSDDFKNYVYSVNDVYDGFGYV